MWELKLKSIVMLTNVIEGASRMVSRSNLRLHRRDTVAYSQTKCHQYWPDLGHTITYGSYRISCIDVVSLGDYDKRYLQLTKVSSLVRL